MNWVMLSISFVGGIAVAVQAMVNGALGKKIGAIEASFFSFLIGTMALFMLMVFFGKGNILNVFTVPKWMLIGGMLGSIYVLFVVLSVPAIGVASTLIAVIMGQVLTSTVLDHFGLAGRSIPIDWQRMLGIAFLAAALFLFYRR